MDFFNMLPLTGISFVFLSLVFIPMEKVFPAKPGQKIFRRQWGLDICYFLGQYLLWNGLVLMAIRHFASSVDGIMPAVIRAAIQSQPFVLQCIEVIVFSDLLIYWGHRLQHNVDFLWRFHKVHHSAPHLDWLAAHREHPLDSIYTITLINLPAFIMGFNLNVLGALVAFRGIWAIYIHSNVRLNIGFLKYIIGSPEMHHWHHDLERDRGNYANISPLMDVIFGTHYSPGHEPEATGIKENFPEHYIGQLVHPLLPRRIIKKLPKPVLKKAALMLFLTLTLASCKSKGIAYLYTDHDKNGNPGDSLKAYSFTAPFEKSLDLYNNTDTLNKTVTMKVHMGIFNVEGQKFAVVTDETGTGFFKFEKGRYKKLFKEKPAIGFMVDPMVYKDFNTDGYTDVLYSVPSGGSYGSDDFLLFFDPVKQTLVHNRKPGLRNVTIEGNTVKSGNKFWWETYTITGNRLVLTETLEYLQGNDSDKKVIWKYNYKGSLVSRDTLKI